jgi:CBS domain-containing protein
MKTVDQVLRVKGRDVWAVAPDATVFEALQEIAEKNIGALVVLHGDQLVGMFSERDYARKVILVGKTSKETQVGELMSTDIVSVGPKQSIEECMALMTVNQVRHLPVLAGSRVVGVISIGDAVKTIVDELESTVDQLKSYISGTD